MLPSLPVRRQRPFAQGAVTLRRTAHRAGGPAEPGGGRGHPSGRIGRMDDDWTSLYHLTESPELPRAWLVFAV
ncbi:hypothetical protein ACFQMG_31445 [Kitasatospora paranensis]|uniref:Uncharacterized protein n=1 Tax=Kitasatospora paranensis TaxID=258053 RepID=A0ABW2G9Q7_9ACTN